MTLKYHLIWAGSFIGIHGSFIKTNKSSLHIFPVHGSRRLMEMHLLFTEPTQNRPLEDQVRSGAFSRGKLTPFLAVLPKPSLQISRAAELLTHSEEKSGEKIWEPRIIIKGWFITFLKTHQGVNILTWPDINIRKMIAHQRTTQVNRK